MTQQVILVDQLQAKYNEIINKLIIENLTLLSENAQLKEDIKNGLAKNSSKPKEQGKELGIIDNGVAQNKRFDP